MLYGLLSYGAIVYFAWRCVFTRTIFDLIFFFCAAVITILLPFNGGRKVLAWIRALAGLFCCGLSVYLYFADVGADPLFLCFAAFWVCSIVLPLMPWPSLQEGCNVPQ